MKPEMWACEKHKEWMLSEVGCPQCAVESQRATIAAIEGRAVRKLYEKLKNLKTDDASEIALDFLYENYKATYDQIAKDEGL